MTELEANLTIIVSSLLDPFVNPLSRTYWVGILLTALVALLYYGVHRPPSWNPKNFWKNLKHPPCCMQEKAQAFPVEEPHKEKVKALTKIGLDADPAPGARHGGCFAGHFSFFN